MIKNKDENVKLGKFISYILRHHPETINLELDANGWAYTEDLINKINISGKKIDFAKLNEIVKTNDKKRYEFSDDYKKIRACQGHSINVDLELKPVKPPQYLYHGTALRNIDIIKTEGLKKISRQYVHLSADRETAYNVGKRYGKPYVMKVEAEKRNNDGYKFYYSKNEVGLTETVKNEYLIFENE